MEVKNQKYTGFSQQLEGKGGRLQSDCFHVTVVKETENPSSSLTINLSCSI